MPGKHFGVFFAVRSRPLPMTPEAPKVSFRVTLRGGYT